MKSSELEYTASVAKIKNRVAVPRYYFDELPKQLKELSFTVSNLETLRQIQMVKKSLENAMDEGLSFNDWKNQLDTGVLKSLSDARLETVYRTNIGVVYGQSTRYNSFTSDVTPYLMYSSVNDSRTRPDHAKLDGVIKRADSKFWDKYMPSWDYNCRCDAIAISTAEAKRRGITKGTPMIEEDGFGSRSLGNMLGNVEKETENAIKSLPNKSPYKQKFTEAQENVKSLVDIWYSKNQTQFQGDE